MAAGPSLSVGKVGRPRRRSSRMRSFACPRITLNALSIHSFLRRTTGMNLNGHVLRSTRLGLDLGMLCAAYCLAFFIRFEGLISAADVEILVFSLPFVLFIKLLSLMVLRVPGRSWKYVGVPQAKNLLAALSTASAVLVINVLLNSNSGSKLFTTLCSQISRCVLLIDLSLAFI